MLHRVARDRHTSERLRDGGESESGSPINPGMNAVPMIARCAERQIDDIGVLGVPRSEDHWLWFLVLSPEECFHSRITAGQQALISVKLG